VKLVKQTTKNSFLTSRRISKIFFQLFISALTPLSLLERASRTSKNTFFASGVNAGHDTTVLKHVERVEKTTLFIVQKKKSR
jgi:hypothetical protein